MQEQRTLYYDAFQNRRAAKMMYTQNLIIFLSVHSEFSLIKYCDYILFISFSHAIYILEHILYLYFIQKTNST